MHTAFVEMIYICVINCQDV